MKDESIGELVTLARGLREAAPRVETTVLVRCIMDSMGVGANTPTWC